MSCAAAMPASADPTPPDFAAPTAFNSVSAYRFWLTFIIVVAISRSGGDCDSTSTRRWSGASWYCGSGVPFGRPRTGMPRSTSASSSWCAK